MECETVCVCGGIALCAFASTYTTIHNNGAYDVLNIPNNYHIPQTTFFAVQIQSRWLAHRIVAHTVVQNELACFPAPTLAEIEAVRSTFIYTKQSSAFAWTVDLKVSLDGAPTVGVRRHGRC